MPNNVTFDSPRIPRNASARTIDDLLSAREQRIISDGTIQENEGAWLLRIVSQRRCSDETKAKVLAMVQRAETVEHAGLKTWADGRRTITGIENVSVPEAPTSTPVGNTGNVTTTNPTNSVGGTIGAMTGASLLARSIVFKKGDTVYEGPYRPSDEIMRKWGLPSLEHFGRIEVAHQGGSYFVYNGQFDLGGGKRGVRLLPVDDSNRGDNATNHATEDALRTRMGLKKGHLATYELTYRHDETNGPEGEGRWQEFPGEGKKGTLATIAGPGGGAQNSRTHWGAGVLYNGQTQNSPETYHGRQFGVHNGYGADAFFFTMEGVSQEVLASQSICASLLMNDGVNFSQRPYKDDHVRIMDVNTALMFARNWILSRGLERGVIPENHELVPPRLQEYLGSEEWTTYCGEHRGSAVNALQFNLSFNKAGFQEVYGADEGAKLWDIYSQVMDKIIADRGLPRRGEERDGVVWEGGAAAESLKNADGSDFVPLWKRLGHTATDVKPFASFEQHAAYFDALRQGADALEQYRAGGGVVPLSPGRSMPFGMQTNADLIAAFITKFHSWPEVGGFQSASAVLAFMQTAMKRHGIGPEAYVKLSAPIINKMLMAEALATGATDDFFATAKAKLQAHLEPLAQMIPANAPNRDQEVEKFKALCAQVEAAVAQNRGPLPRPLAYVKFREMIEVDLKAAREQEVGDRQKNVSHNCPPGLLADLIHGFHDDKNWNGGLIKVQYLATLMDHSELKQV
jgi:hypothetical protein